ncbi:MAG: hypothetical protein QXW98_06445 [Candidatus Caldarchaeum sp.]
MKKEQTAVNRNDDVVVVLLTTDEVDRKLFYPEEVDRKYDVDRDTLTQNHIYRPHTAT